MTAVDGSLTREDGTVRALDDRFLLSLAGGFPAASSLLEVFHLV